MSDDSKHQRRKGNDHRDRASPLSSAAGAIKVGRAGTQLRCAAALEAREASTGMNLHTRLDTSHIVSGSIEVSDYLDSLYPSSSSIGSSSFPLISHTSVIRSILLLENVNSLSTLSIILIFSHNFSCISSS